MIQWYAAFNATTSIDVFSVAPVRLIMFFLLVNGSHQGALLYVDSFALKAGAFEIAVSYYEG